MSLPGSLSAGFVKLKVAAWGKSLLACRRALGAAGVTKRFQPCLWGRAAPYCTSTEPINKKDYLWMRYKEEKKATEELILSSLNSMLNPDAIFSNNEMSLLDIEIYGFDYDYTLAFYSKDLHTLIFNTARDLLINEHRVAKNCTLHRSVYS